MPDKIDKDALEIERIKALYSYERQLNEQGYQLIAGTDEAGRGPIAGPVVAASVMLRTGTFIKGLNDSKKLSAKKREAIYEEILSKCICYGISVISNEEIDRINILQSAYLAMKKSLDEMEILPEYVLVDGLFNNRIEIPQMAIVKGDSKSASVAAASVIAKVYRDRIMDEYDKEYPQYGFASHKGYPTKKHIEAVREYGVLKIHRKTFTPISTWL